MCYTSLVEKEMNEAMHFLLDAGAVAVLLLLAVIGAKKGFIKACADFCGSLLAMIGAGILSGPAAEWIYGAFFRTALEDKITGAVAGLSAADAVDTVFKDFPEVIQRALSAAGITEGSVMAQLQNGAAGVARGITDALSPMLIGLIRVLAMLVLFILLTVVIRAVATLLTGLFELPVLHGLNSLLGALFGILLAVLFVWIALACVRVFLPMLGTDVQAAVNGLLDESVLAGALYKFNPAYLLIG